jgi:protein-disulfide isomerase
VRFEYRHFPFIGPESNEAAEASECAAEQDRFWPYHDTLFLNQRGENLGTFNEQSLKAYAIALGLDEVAFDECLDSNRYQGEIMNELAEARDRTVRSTPTLIVNGEIIEGVVPFEQLQRRIEAEIN